MALRYNQVKKMKSHSCTYGGFRLTIKGEDGGVKLFYLHVSLKLDCDLFQSTYPGLTLPAERAIEIDMMAGVDILQGQLEKL